MADDYGVPDWISATRTISADEAAKDYNADFFGNDTIPRFAIKVTGGELTEESKRDLRQMLNGLREESHRTVILEVDKFANQLDDDDIEIELQPLGQGISEEMSFEAFREKNEAEIAKVLEIPPIKIGNTGTSNRSNSEQQDRDFALEVIQPEQHKFAQRLYQTIHQRALGVTDWTLEYELRGADQPKQDAEVARRKIQAVNGAIPVNRALEMIGEEPLPDDVPIDGDATLVSEVRSQTPGAGSQLARGLSRINCRPRTTRSASATGPTSRPTSPPRRSSRRSSPVAISTRACTTSTNRSCIFRSNVTKASRRCMPT